jgi:hypothetical protein
MLFRQKTIVAVERRSRSVLSSGDFFPGWSRLRHTILLPKLLVIGREKLGLSDS